MSQALEVREKYAKEEEGKDQGGGEESLSADELRKRRKAEESRQIMAEGRLESRRAVRCEDEFVYPWKKVKGDFNILG